MIASQNLLSKIMASPEAAVSLAAALVSVVALIIQIIIFLFEGSRAKVTMSCVFLDPNVGFIGNYTAPDFQKYRPDSKAIGGRDLSQLAKDGEGIELLEVSVAVAGRTPTSISNISLGYYVWHLQSHPFALRSFNEFTPISTSLSEGYGRRYSTKFPERIDVHSEVKYLFYYWDAVHSTTNSWGKKSKKLRAYVTLAGQKKKVKSRSAFKPTHNQASLLVPGKVPLRLLLARFFIQKTGEGMHTEPPKPLEQRILGSPLIITRLLESFLAGNWPQDSKEQYKLIEKFFQKKTNLYIVEIRADNKRILQDQPGENLFFSIGPELIAYINRWKESIDWKDIAYPDFYNHWQEAMSPTPSKN